MRKRVLSKDLEQQIRYLRSRGRSYPEISEELGISRTTVYRYGKSVGILPEFIQTLISKRGGSSKRRIEKEQKALEIARGFTDKVTNRERLLYLCALYWAEGSKKDFSFSNTDPSIIKVFIDGLRFVLGVENDRIRISVRIYQDIDGDKAISFWSGIVGIPKDQFVGVEVLNQNNRGKNKYGMCRVRVAKGGDILKMVQGINKIMMDYLPGPG